MGLYVVSWSQQAFDNPAKRPAPWAPRKDSNKTHPLLKLHGATGLWGSIRIIRVTNDTVTNGSERPYAAAHQFGATTSPHVIKPKFKKALSWPGAKHPVKSVNHPGSKISARPFMPFFSTGRMMPTAKDGVEKVGRAKVISLLG